jgi:putative transposase
MRTVEFKLDLNQSQQAKVDDWLNVLRWVWNRGLHLLEEFDSNTRWDKASKSWGWSRIVESVALSLVVKR